MKLVKVKQRTVFFPQTSLISRSRLPAGTMSCKESSSLLFAAFDTSAYRYRLDRDNGFLSINTTECFLPYKKHEGTEQAVF